MTASRPLTAALAAAALAVLAAGAARAENDVGKGILGDWVAKPFIWHIAKVKGCRYRQAITIEREVAPGRFVGRYEARTTCVGRAWNVSGRLTVTVSGRKVTIDGNARQWIVETVRYLSPSRMEGKDAKGHPMIYRRPKGQPTS